MQIHWEPNSSLAGYGHIGVKVYFPLNHYSYLLSFKWTTAFEFFKKKTGYGWCWRRAYGIFDPISGVLLNLPRIRRSYPDTKKVPVTELCQIVGVEWRGRGARLVLPWSTLRPPPFPTPGQAWGTYVVCGCRPHAPFVSIFRLLRHSSWRQSYFEKKTM